MKIQDRCVWLSKKGEINFLVKKEKEGRRKTRKKKSILSTYHFYWTMFNIFLLDVHRNLPECGEKKMFLILTTLNESYGEWYERACTQDLCTDVLIETEKRIGIGQRSSEHLAKSTTKSLEICLFTFKYDQDLQWKYIQKGKKQNHHN